jgi:hypothetical protein
MGTFKGTVTRNSNGSAEIAPFDNANPPREFAMGSEVEINFNVIRTAEEIEAANSKAKNRPAPVPAATSEPATEDSAARQPAARKTAASRA